MPIYEYKCTKCGLFKEEFQNINDDPLVECSECSGHLVLLLSLSSVNVVYEPNEQYEKEIKPEAKRIAEKIKNGDENLAADFFGVNE